MKAGILYSFCWEDHDVLSRHVKPGDDILTVCSAGDIALDCLTEDVGSIDMIDTNIDQLNLARLKLSCFKQLPYDEVIEVYAAFHSTMSTPDRWAIISTLKLDASLKAWSIHQQPMLQIGLISAGRFERYLRQFVDVLLPFVVRRSHILQFLQSESLDQQRAIYNKSINTWRYRLLFKFFFGRFYMAKKGRHPDLLKHAQVEPASVFYRRMEHAWTEVPIHENYFFRLILQGVLDPKLKLPNSLVPNNLYQIRRRADKLSFYEASARDWVLNHADKRYDHVYLSDITETMSREEAETLFLACKKVLKPGGKLYVWNNLVDRMPTQGWVKNEEASRAFWNNRKVSFYGDFGIFEPIID